MSTFRLPATLGLLLAALTLALAACGGDDDPAPPTGASASADRWPEIEREARGQTVRFWMFGGDDRVNAYVDGPVRDALEARDVELRRVPIADTADAVKRVLAERRAGRESGGVDLIWINGENFAGGKRAGLWLPDWAAGLPNARFLDPADQTVTRDFQVPVDGQASPWQRAAFTYVHDRVRTPEPPRDLDALLAWARENPGRFTYPAPPDFTGSAFVRQVVAAKGEDEAFAYLRELQPLLYREGRVQPKSQAEQDRLFGDGEVDIAMAYDANVVASGVRRGVFPGSARPFRLGEGTLSNVSFVTIPANAANAAGAQVLADVLLDPALQAEKADPDVLGNPTVLDPARLPDGADEPQRSAYVLADPGPALEELPADQVEPLETRWRREVAR